MGRPRKQPREILIARESGYVEVDGVGCSVVKGVTRAHPDAKIVDLTPDWWEPINVHYPAVEQMTAAPGELRGE